jgi:hypothetical protein
MTKQLVGTKIEPVFDATGRLKGHLHHRYYTNTAPTAPRSPVPVTFAAALPLRTTTTARPVRCPGGCGEVAPACECLPAPPDTLKLVVAMQAARRAGVAPALALAAQAPVPRRMVIACRTCRGAVCRCGVPASPSFEVILDRQRALGLRR